jgi:hypothetical protein
MRSGAADALAPERARSDAPQKLALQRGRDAEVIEFSDRVTVYRAFTARPGRSLARDALDKAVRRLDRRGSVVPAIYRCLPACICLPRLPCVRDGFDPKYASTT